MLYMYCYKKKTYKKLWYVPECIYNNGMLWKYSRKKRKGL